jgi:hypothetical protein
MTNELHNLKTQIEELESLIESNPDEIYDEKLHELEEKFEQIKDYPFIDFESKILRHVQKRLHALRSELDLYDEQGERDAMFPNGEDE